MFTSKMWQKPSIHDYKNKGSHRKVGWLELFYDLFFVVAIASITHDFSAHLSLRNFLIFAFSIILLWWVWIDFTYYSNRFETEGLDNRFFTLLIMLSVAGFAIFSHQVFTGNYQGFLLSYIFAKAVISFLWLRAGYYNKTFRIISNVLVRGYGFAVVLNIIALFIDVPYKYYIIALSMFVDLITPLFIGKNFDQFPLFNKSKITERFGLFIIVVLGEMIVGVINGISLKEHVGLTQIFGAMTALLISFGFWWIYFDFIGRRNFHPNTWRSIAWSYLHLPLTISFITIGAVLVNIISNDGILSRSTQFALCLSFASAFVFLGLLEFNLEQKDNEAIHKIFSPLLSIKLGILCLVFGFLNFEITNTVLILFLISMLSIKIIYGISIWLKQK